MEWNRFQRLESYIEDILEGLNCRGLSPFCHEGLDVLEKRRDHYRVQILEIVADGREREKAHCESFCPCVLA